MRAYDPAEPLVSLHVPRTGGTALRAALERWFPRGRLLLHYGRPGIGAPPLRHRPARKTCIHGHFNAGKGFGADAYYPEARQFIVMLREPLDRFASLYFHFARIAASGADRQVAQDMDARPGFANFIEDFAAEHATGTGGISTKWQLPGAPDVAAIRRAMEERFVFVGLTETYEASLAALAVALGKSRFAARIENAAPRDAIDLSHWRRFVEANFPEDCEIYEVARRLNREGLKHYR